MHLTDAQPILKPAVGFNITDVSKTPGEGNAVGRIGWQAGVSIAYGDGLYGEAGIFFAKKSTEFPANTNGQEYTSNFEGIRIPLTIGYQIVGNEKSATGLRIFGGTSFLFITDVETLNYTKDDFKSATTGVFTGLGADLLFLFAEAKYEWSLTEISKVETFDIGKQRSLFVSAGLRFPL